MSSTSWYAHAAQWNWMPRCYKFTYDFKTNLLVNINGAFITFFCIDENFGYMDRITMK